MALMATTMKITTILLTLLLAFQVVTLHAQPPTPAVARSDSVDTKMKLLQAAIAAQDFDLARSLTHSLRDSFIQIQHDAAPLADSVIPLARWMRIGELPKAWQAWAKPWLYCKRLELREPAGLDRHQEPIEIAVSFPSDQVTSIARELRIARVAEGRLIEVPCQVLRETFRPTDRLRHAQVLLMVDCPAKSSQQLLLFYGNADAELPEYPSDLVTEGENWGLDISNAHFKAKLSRQTGQLERLIMRREHGLELYAGGEGHGEPPGIDWAHDYVDAGNFQKLRISLWDGCPDYEVIRGPLCTIIRRWGFPHSPVHPIDTPARLKIEVEYRFYAGLPWFHKFGSMQAIQQFEATALRDDEWVFSGQPFTDQLWMDADGKLHMGTVPPAEQEKLWGIGFSNRDSKDAFVALFLEHSAKDLPELKHNGSPNLYYRWHGSVWSRYPLPVKTVPAGAELIQRNAYVTLPIKDEASKLSIEQLRRTLLAPLEIKGDATVNGKQPFDSVAREQPDRLARAGEAGDTLVSKQAVWTALKDCKDAQLYTADINVVDLGLVYDIRVRGDVVTLVMTTTNAGRGRLGYFIDGSISVHPTLSVPIRERLEQVPGVRQVVFQHVANPAWNSNRLSEAGRQKLGLK